MEGESNTLFFPHISFLDMMLHEDGREIGVELQWAGHLLRGRIYLACFYSTRNLLLRIDCVVVNNTIVYF